MVLFKNKVMNKIPELKIGDGKEKKRFEVKGWVKGLKDFAINVIIRW